MGLIDIHTHILPGTDDGAIDLRTALEMIKSSLKCGVTDIILTPHYDEYKSCTPKPVAEFEAIKKAVTDKGINVKLYLGSEIRYSSNTISLLESGDVFTLAGSKYVLLEFSYDDSFNFIRNAINDVAMRGYFPVLAHIERYRIMENIHAYDLDLLKKTGAYFQVNSSSLLSGNLSIKRLIKKLLKYDFIDFIASDCHDMKHRQPDLDKGFNYISKKFGLEKTKEIFIENPNSIISNINLKQRRNTWK